MSLLFLLGQRDAHAHDLRHEHSHHRTGLQACEARNPVSNTDLQVHQQVQRLCQEPDSIYHRLRPTIGHVLQSLLLEHVLRHVAGEVVVVLDRAMIHRSKAVQAFVLLHERLSLVYLPPYAPELNPIELIWADLKRNVVGNFCATSVTALKKRLTVGWQRIRRKGLPLAFIRGTPFSASLLT